MAYMAMFAVGGLPEKFGWIPEHVRERVLSTFKHTVRMRRDCDSLR
jgi:hypothetical protein